MADGDQITAEEYASWLAAPEAIRRVSTAMNDFGVAAQTILRRLSAGLLRAHVKAGDVEFSGKNHPLKQFGAVPARIAKAWANSDYPADWQFWTSGDTEITLRGQGDYGYEVDYDWRLFGIRFDPDGIAELIPGAPAPPIRQAIPTAPQTEEAEQPQRGPPVAKAALEAWYAAYQKAFQGAEDTEAKAVESARGCFPGKSVSREAIRALRGTQKRGPKGPAAK